MPRSALKLQQIYCFSADQRSEETLQIPIDVWGAAHPPIRNKTQLGDHSNDAVFKSIQATTCDN